MDFCKQVKTEKEKTNDSKKHSTYILLRKMLVNRRITFCKQNVQQNVSIVYVLFFKTFFISTCCFLLCKKQK